MAYHRLKVLLVLFLNLHLLRLEFQKFLLQSPRLFLHVLDLFRVIRDRTILIGALDFQISKLVFDVVLKLLAPAKSELGLRLRAAHYRMLCD